MSLFWDDGAARVANFTTAAAPKGETTVRIELRVSSGWELADIVRQLAEQRNTAEQASKGARK